MTVSFLVNHAYWLGCMTVAVIYGVHNLILTANRIMPPQLAIGRLATMLLMFLCGLLWWTIAFLRHFHRNNEGDRS